MLAEQAGCKELCRARRGLVITLDLIATRALCDATSSALLSLQLRVAVQRSIYSSEPSPPSSQGELREGPFPFFLPLMIAH